MSIKDHYDNHLGNFYAWMVGNFEEKQMAQQLFLTTNDIVPKGNKIAIDLGAGHGLQAVSLAKLGFEVHAVDFNHQLLHELQQNSVALPVWIIEDELLNFLDHTALQPEIVVCMGDTLTHLESFTHVEKLIQRIYEKLSPKGKCILSFRDLTKELVGDDRFIQVRSDATRILTCFLEYFPDKVVVHDILHENTGSVWQQKISSYPKLRVNENMITSLLSKSGFTISSSQMIDRMIHVIATK